VSQFFIPLLISLFIIAALLREDFVFILLYLLAGAFAIGHWWSRKGLKSLEVNRSLPQRAFLDQEIQVELELENPSLLPLVWLRLHDSLPVGLSIPNFYSQILSIGPYEKVKLEYPIQPRKRGYYSIGPLSLFTGDILGMGEQVKREEIKQDLIVYPKIIPLSNMELPSRSPMGTLRSNVPIFADPTRTIGKRDYAVGDSLRHVDWKASASIGRLQVKKFEPSISLETAIFLDLHESVYYQKTRIQSTELAVIAGASIANWIVSKRQSVGLFTNGFDPLAAEGISNKIPLAKGHSHLIRILETLGRIEIGDKVSIYEMVQQESPNLPWGTTLILITGNIDPQDLDVLFEARRRGQNAVLVLCGQVMNFRYIKSRAEYFNFPVYHLFNERDLDIWRRSVSR
jgi:uncharacterized protein (DUF58 family)